MRVSVIPRVGVLPPSSFRHADRRLEVGQSLPQRRCGRLRDAVERQPDAQLVRLLHPFAFDEEQRVVPCRHDEADGARCVPHDHGGIDLGGAEGEMTGVAWPQPADGGPHAQALGAEDRVFLAGARRGAEARRQLPAIDAAVTFERVLQVKQEVGPAGVEPVDVVVP